jgi:esterase/lipase superfamily enzyme/uncharacterized protein YjbI with pentapeptide repeats
MPDHEILAKLEEGREAWNSFMLERSLSFESPILDLSEAVFEGKDLSQHLFAKVNLSKAKLNGANLSQCTFELVDFTESELRGVDLTNASLRVVIATETDFTNANLADLSCISVQALKANFVQTNLRASRLDGRFDSAEFSEADLTSADLRGANFVDASFRDANLRNANLTEANLEGTDLRGAIFEGTNLQNATIYRTLPADIDFSDAKNVPTSKPRKVIGLASAPGSSGGTLYDPPESEQTATMIRVFYATDRTSSSGRWIFGTRVAPRLSYGYCNVSIPLYDRNIGEVPRPSIWKLEFRENLSRHVAIVSVKPLDKDQFQHDISVQNTQGSPGVLLFIHGYRVSFEDAIRRTAQLAHDLKFNGVPVLYSWTSQNTLRGYPEDLANNELTWGKLSTFLCQLGSSSRSIHIVSHSMGGRAVCNATARLAKECPGTNVEFENLIFAAPDVHVPFFEESLADLRQLSRCITLYFCPGDLALAVSKRFHSVPRAGEDGLIAAGLDNIDISEFSGDFPYHSGYGERGVLSDITEIIQHGTKPDARFGLARITGIRGEYFRMKR